MLSLSANEAARILEIRKRFEDADPSEDLNLIQQVSSHLISHLGETSYEASLIHNCLILSNVLRKGRNREAVLISRSTLMYLVEEDDYIPDDDPRGLDDDAYVVSLAITEIQSIGSQFKTEELMLQPTQNETDSILVSLEEHYSSPAHDIKDLISTTRIFLGALERVRSAGFFGKFFRNIGLLVWQVEQADSMNENARWAQAGLEYLVAKEDIIPDDLGLLGYLDDRFAVDWVIHKIRSDQDSVQWNHYVAKAEARWPFLKWMLMRSEDGVSGLSDFITINIALALEQGEGNLGNKLLVGLPQSGPLPFLTALSLAISKAGQIKTTCNTELRLGQKVIVGNNPEVVWVYKGERKQKYFHWDSVIDLEYAPPRGEKFSCIRPGHWKRHLKPIHYKKACRGKNLLPDMQHSFPMRAVERLLHSDQITNFDSHNIKVILVSQFKDNLAFADSLRIFGEKLNEIVPIAKIRRDGVPELISKSWGENAQPALYLARDLVDARNLLEASDSQNAAVIIDADKLSITSDIATLDEVSESGCPVTLFSRRYRQRLYHELSKIGFSGFQWENSDIHGVFTPIMNNNHSINTYRSRVVDSTLSNFELIEFDGDLFTKAEKSIVSLWRCAEKFGVQDQFGEIMKLSRILLVSLGRTFIPALESSYISRKLTELESAVHSHPHRNLDDDMRHQLESHLHLYQTLANQCHTDNPKKDFILKQIKAGNRSRLILRNKLSLENMDYFHDHPDGGLISAVTFPKYGQQPRNKDQDIVAGWLTRDSIAPLYNLPRASRVMILAYPFEMRKIRAWERGFNNTVQKFEGDFNAHSIISNAFGLERKSTSAHSELPFQIPKIKELDTETDVDETIDQILNEYQVKRYSSSSERTDGDSLVDAVRFTFAHGYSAFLTEDYKPTVLRASNSQEESFSIKSIPLDDLREGDYLIFHEGVDSDAIRSVANRDPKVKAVRPLAGLWQAALKKHMTDHKLSIDSVFDDLKNRGCIAHYVTVRNWILSRTIIGPRDDRVIDMIAVMTQDPSLLGKVEECKKAITMVRGAHLQSEKIIRKEFLEKLEELGEFPADGLFDFSNYYAVQLEWKISKSFKIWSSHANHLLSDEE